MSASDTTAHYNDTESHIAHDPRPACHFQCVINLGTFKIFDPDDSGSINIQEFKEMVRLCRGDKYVEKGTAEFQETVKLMKELDSNGNGKITKAEFAKAEKSCAILFWPLIELQARNELFRIMFSFYAYMIRFSIHRRSCGRNSLEINGGRMR